MGLMEKTDRIDAGVIGMPRLGPASQTQQNLACWVTRLRQLTELLAQANQRRLLDEPVAIPSEIIGPARCATSKCGSQMLAADPLWAELDAEFRTVKGVAGRTVARLMAELPEIGTLSNKAVGLAGLAPIANDRASAPVNGPSAAAVPVRGRRNVRRFDKDFGSQRGKPKKVVRIALAHKLLTRLNAKARDVRNAPPIMQ